VGPYGANTQSIYFLVRDERISKLRAARLCGLLKTLTFSESLAMTPLVSIDLLAKLPLLRSTVNFA
jgi:hypothetical protein